MERDQISKRIGERLKQLRQSRNLSLDVLAQLTDVSKPMLAQIERGTSNPTVATLWKIASGLNVPFTTFVNETYHAKLLRAEDQIGFFEDANRYQAFTTFTSPGGQTELFRLRLLPGAIREAEAHGLGVYECLTVGVGRLSVEVGNVTYELGPGDSLHFQADVPHVYANQNSEVCEAHMAIFYPFS